MEIVDIYNNYAAYLIEEAKRMEEELQRDATTIFDGDVNGYHILIKYRCDTSFAFGGCSQDAYSVVTDMPSDEARKTTVKILKNLNHYYYYINPDEELWEKVDDKFFLKLIEHEC